MGEREQMRRGAGRVAGASRCAGAAGRWLTAVVTWAIFSTPARLAWPIPPPPAPPQTTAESPSPATRPAEDSTPASGAHGLPPAGSREPVVVDDPISRLDYPAGSARDRGLQGETLLRVEIDERGSVAAVKIVRSVGGGDAGAALDALAARTAYGLRFQPALDEQGNPVPYVIPGWRVLWRLETSGSGARAPRPAPRACAELPPAAGSELGTGNDDFAHGRFWMAAERFDRVRAQAAATTSERQAAEFLLGKSLFKNGLRSSALEVFRQIGAAGPSHAYYRLALQWVVTLVVEPPRTTGAAAALASYSLEELGAPDLEPFWDILLVELARHHLRQGEAKKAMAALDRRAGRRQQHPVPPPWDGARLAQTASRLSALATLNATDDDVRAAGGVAESPDEVTAALDALGKERFDLQASSVYCGSPLKSRLLESLALRERACAPRAAPVLGGIVGAEGPTPPTLLVVGQRPPGALTVAATPNLAEYQERPTPHLPEQVKRRLVGQHDVMFFAVVCVSQSGEVAEIRVKKGIEGADRAIVETMRRWRLLPQPLPLCFPVKLVYDIAN